MLSKPEILFPFVSVRHPADSHAITFIGRNEPKEIEHFWRILIRCTETHFACLLGQWQQLTNKLHRWIVAVAQFLFQLLHQIDVELFVLVAFRLAIRYKRRVYQCRQHVQYGREEFTAKPHKTNEKQQKGEWEIDGGPNLFVDKSMTPWLINCANKMAQSVVAVAFFWIASNIPPTNENRS